MALKCPSCGYDNEDEALCCNLCQVVLRKEKPKVPPPPAPAPQGSPLPYPGWAAQMVERSPNDLMLMGLGVELDWSPASIAGLDGCLDAMYGTEGEAPDSDQYAPSKGKQNLILGFGAYFGEVCIRALDGAWQDDPRYPGQPLPAAVVFGGNARLFPFTRLLKRLKNGSQDSLFVLLLAATKDHPEARKAWAAGFLKQARRISRHGAMHPSERAPVVKRFCDTAAAWDPALAVEAAALAAAPCETRPPPASEQG